jgi:hypothetical protein
MFNRLFRRGRSDKTALTPGYAPPSPKELLALALCDPGGTGQPVPPSWAEPLGAFTEDAVSPDDFEPDFPRALEELLGPEE